MPNIIYAKEPLTTEARKLSIFLAGPTPRAPTAYISSWRPEAIKHLRRLFQGVILSPEPRDGVWHGEYDDQVEWEAEAMDAATCIAFWIPRKLDTMPGFTTNDEWGYYKASGKVVLGTPPEAEKVKYQAWWAKRLGVPHYIRLEDTMSAAIFMAHHPLRRGVS